MCYSDWGCGTVFKLARNGTETVSYSFQGSPDGETPNGGLIDKAGSLFGTTLMGGNSSICDCGTVFKVEANGLESVLYSFCSLSNCGDGAMPAAGLISDKKGNLYGT